MIKAQNDPIELIPAVIMQYDRLASGYGLRFGIETGVDRVIGFELPVIRARTTRGVSRSALVGFLNRIRQRNIPAYRAFRRCSRIIKNCCIQRRFVRLQLPENNITV